MGKGKRNRNNRCDNVLKQGATIKRKKCSCCGEIYSVLCIGEYEIYSVPVNKEQEMIKKWNDGTLENGRIIIDFDWTSE